MARSARKVCSKPGCPNITDRGKGRCPSCERTADRARGTSTERGYDGRWRRFREQVLAERPFCEEPTGCAALADHLDHIDGEGPLGARGFDVDNVTPLCPTHHAAKTARENGGGWQWRQP